MHKTVMIRLKDEVYKAFLEAAQAENRSISNLIETAALTGIREKQLFTLDQDLIFLNGYNILLI